MLTSTSSSGWRANCAVGPPGGTSSADRRADGGAPGAFGRARLSRRPNWPGPAPQAGIGPAGRTLPADPCMATGRIGWRALPSPGISSSIPTLAAHGARRLSGRGVLSSLRERWPGDPPGARPAGGARRRRRRPPVARGWQRQRARRLPGGGHPETADQDWCTRRLWRPPMAIR